MKAPPKILVVRTDRLGDVLMSLPTLKFLRQAFKKSEISFLCAPAVAPAIAPFCVAHAIHIIEDRAERAGAWKKQFQTERFDAALFLFARRPVLVGAWLAKIPVRLGSYSKLVSFALLNSGIRQKRSIAHKNEAEYNLELGRALSKKLLGQVAHSFVSPIEIGIDREAEKHAVAELRSRGISEGMRYVVVHPGMGGSAVNASAESYAVLIADLRRHLDARVVVTVGPSIHDKRILSELKRTTTDLIFIEELELPVIREVFRKAMLVVAPSTGPLHLAHYTGVPTVGIFSPVRSHKKERWAPWGGTGETTILSPNVDCPAEKECLGTKCRHFPCVDQLFEGDLLSATRNALKEACQSAEGTG